ncbi:MAG: tyrosine-type recombinase/integrase [Sphaerotilus sp.]|nr:tyrosine-type recombinase/integrase [Sphaerotilus sp.]
MQDHDGGPARLLQGPPGLTQAAPLYLADLPRRRSAGMRRRVVVFFSVFALCAAASLAYTFLRPAIYLASARLQVVPQGKLPKGETVAADSTSAVLVELQVLNSRPLLESVVARLGKDGELGVDPAAAVQGMLNVTRLEGTNVIQIEARGPHRTLLPRLINVLIETYGEQQLQAGQSSSQAELADAREEARVIDEKTAAKKREVEAFRMRSNIVSAERDENQTLSRVKGLGASLSTATDREAVAEGKVHAQEQAIQEGKRAPQAKDNPTVAGLENRLSQLREEWRAMERKYTPQYLDMDPNAVSLKTRIGNLEQQLASERVKSQQNTLAEAREELASARAVTRRLQQRLAEDKQSVQAFSRQFGDYQAMQDELRGLDQMRMAARQSLLALEASELARKPRIKVVEAATTPQTSWRPLYWRDAGISLAGSLAIAFLAVWFVEFFDRSEPVTAGPSTVIIPQPWVAAGRPDLLAVGASAGPAQALANPSRAMQLAAPEVRGLSDEEARRLLGNSTAENLPLLVCMLCGLTDAELIALRAADLDLAANTLSIPGESQRSFMLDEPLLQLLPRRAAPLADAPLFAHVNGQPLSAEDVQAVVVTSALDAGLANAQTIGPDTLRHTYIAHLVRQGLRFSDLGKLVGRVPAQVLNSLAPLAEGSKRVELASVDRLIPAVRTLLTK